MRKSSAITLAGIAGLLGFIAGVGFIVKKVFDGNEGMLEDLDNLKKQGEKRRAEKSNPKSDFTLGNISFGNSFDRFGNDFDPTEDFFGNSGEEDSSDSDPSNADAEKETT